MSVLSRPAGTHWKPSTLVLSLVAALTLLALACNPAVQPTAAPTVAAPVPELAAPTATVPAGAQVVPGLQAPTTGKYIDKAGLRIFVPEGFEFGGPIIPPDPREPRYGGTLHRYSAGDPPSIDPYHTATTQMLLPMATVYERLVHIPAAPGVDPSLFAPIPGLAESWEVSDDFLTYTFHLRKGVKWHNLPPVNGRELDAEDVKATFDLLTSPGSTQRGFLSAVDRVEVVGKYTAVYHMKRVNPGMLAVISTPGRGFILPREIASTTTTFNRKLRAIGTGPFMVDKDYEFKVGITERRNPDYWVSDERGNRLPYLDAYKVSIIGDNSAALAAFRTGKIDEGPAIANATAARALVRTNPTTIFQESSGSPYGQTGTGFRLDKAPWNDVRVRRAMAMSLDLKTESQTVYEVPFDGTSYVPGVWIGQPKNTVEALTADCGCPWYTYDPKRARALLAEAGFSQGLTTTFEAHYYGQQARVEQYELRAAYWKAIGANVGIKQLDLTIFRSNLERATWPDLGHIFIVPIPASMDAVVEAFLPDNGSNPLTGLVNDEKLTALVKEFQASYRDEARRKDLYGQIRAYYLDQVFSLPLALGRGYGYQSPRVRNWQKTNSYLISLDTRVAAVAWIDDDYSFAR